MEEKTNKQNKGIMSQGRTLKLLGRRSHKREWRGTYCTGIHTLLPQGKKGGKCTWANRVKDVGSRESCWEGNKATEDEEYKRGTAQ